MAVFDESKVINALHPEKAEVGKKYWFADEVVQLKEHVENNSKTEGILDCIGNKKSVPFHKKAISDFRLLYPYEEPQNQRMTYRQLAEWMAKGNGEFTESNDRYCLSMFTMSYLDEIRDKPVKQGIFIRTWDSEEWEEPTVDVYERDCKEVEKTNVGEKHE